MPLLKDVAAAIGHCNQEALKAAGLAAQLGLSTPRVCQGSADLPNQAHSGFRVLTATSKRRDLLSGKSLLERFAHNMKLISTVKMTIITKLNKW